MTDTTKNLLIFGLGIIWAMKSSKKAYAPNITTFTTKKELDPNRKCPEGTRKEPIGCCKAMTPGCMACLEESRRLGGFKCVDNAIGGLTEKDCPVLPSNPQSQSDCPSGTRFIDTSLREKRYIGPPPPSYCEDKGVCGCYRMNNVFDKRSCLNRINSCYTKKNCPPGSSCVNCTPASGIQTPFRWCCRTPEEIRAERERSKYDYLIPRA